MITHNEVCKMCLVMQMIWLLLSVVTFNKKIVKVECLLPYLCNTSSQITNLIKLLTMMK